MTEVQTTEPPLPGDPQTDTPKPEVKAPEPWTAAKVLEWNAYYDVYVALGVLLLTFLASSNQLTTSATWTQLQAGREISQSFAPTTDVFSLSQSGERWVHTNWLSDLLHYQVYKLVSGFAQFDATATPNAIQAAREQWGIGGLIALDAFLRVLTVLVLLAIRRKGPGLWWVGSVVVAALVGFPLVFGILTGVFTTRYGLGSWPYGEFLFALELLCLFRAFGQGKIKALYFLVPIFALWANLDESFLFGLVVLGFGAAELALPSNAKARSGAKDAPAKLSARTPLIVLGISVLACLLNPSTFRIFPAAISSVAPWIGWTAGPPTPGQVSIFTGADTIPAGSHAAMQLMFLVLAVVGYASFLVNGRLASRGLLLAYTGGVLLWAMGLVRYQLEFAALLAVVLAWNGQEWFLSRFGAEGHLAKGWAVWSIGGRAVTICLVFLGMLRVIFGVPHFPLEPLFGFGFNPDGFAFEAAEFVKDSPIQGNILNTWLAEGDAMVWRAYPKRKTFIDSRRHLFTKELLAKDRALRGALRDGKPAAWKPILDEYKATAVLMDRFESPKTYESMLSSPDWIRFYDDGRCALFGRGDAVEPDIAYFKTHKLDADTLVYQHPEATASSDQLPPTPSGLAIYQSRAQRRMQSHTLAANNWLHPPELTPGTIYFADPAHCFMAIREARRALFQDPGESLAYRVLAQAYRTLLTQEARLLAGLEVTTDRDVTIRHFTPQVIRLLPERFFQP